MANTPWPDKAAKARATRTRKADLAMMRRLIDHGFAVTAPDDEIQRELDASGVVSRPQT